MSRFSIDPFARCGPLCNQTVGGTCDKPCSAHANVAPRPRPTCKACGGYLKPHFVDGYCGNGCDAAYEAGLLLGRRLAMAEVVEEARRSKNDAAMFAGGIESKDRNEHYARGWADGVAQIAAWAEARGK